MTKQPTRLANFEIPREQSLQREGELDGESKALPVSPPATVPTVPPAAVSAPVQLPRPAPPPVEEPRRQIGARVRVSLAERLRTYMFVSRESQQDAVEAALDAYLASKGF